MTELHLVFVYGTLKNGFGNHRLISQRADSRLIKRCARTKEAHYLMMPCHQSGGFPFAIFNGEGHHLMGELWEVSNDTLQDLHRLEGVPHMYKVHSMRVEDFEREVFMYVHSSSVDASREYYNRPKRIEGYSNPQIYPLADNTMVWVDVP